MAGGWQVAEHASWVGRSTYVIITQKVAEEETVGLIGAVGAVAAAGKYAFTGIALVGAAATSVAIAASIGLYFCSQHGDE